MRKVINALGKSLNGYKKEKQELKQKVVKQMFTLATAGFGLVAALAWNEAIKAFFKEYVDPYLQVGTGVLSRFVYAILVTSLAVFVTYQLSKLSQKLEK